MTQMEARWFNFITNIVVMKVLRILQIVVVVVAVCLDTSTLMQHSTETTLD